MQILVINSGSSSVKADVLEDGSGRRLASLRVERLGTPAARARVDEGDWMPSPSDHAGAIERFLPGLVEGQEVQAVGHRVVHGGEAFTQPVRIDDEVEEAVEALIPLAPLHNPANLAGIRAARRLLADLPHVAVFDTAFHATMPRRARSYALPSEVAERHGLRRYGFHGPSHDYVVRSAAHFLGDDLDQLRIVSCHLGNGASVCAVEYGRSVETSMGLTPLEGLVMGTRSGDVDPGIVLQLARELGMEEADELLNKASGLAGLSGRGNDLRDIEQGAAEGDERCRLALHVFCHRLRKYIGAYAAVMGGVDAIVFTGGIGQNSATVRHRVCQRLEFLGARLDEDANREARADREHPVRAFHLPNSRVRLLAVATDEEHAIAEKTAAIAGDRHQTRGLRGVPVAVSARHVHLTPAAVETLFGPGATLTKFRDISQPGQYACQEKLTLVGPKRSIEGVRVLGPVRSDNQVEISRTDEFHLGLDAPVRASGDVANSPGIKLVGPAGELVIDHGVICAWRHIHMHPDDAAHFGVKDKDVVEVAIDSEGRDLVFGDVMVRVKDDYLLEMHIDTDEANAAEIVPGQEGALVRSGAVAALRKKRI